MFTAYAKELFEKWYEKSNIPQSSEIEFYAGDSSGYMGIWLDNFYKLHQSMQHGVYLQFLREHGIDFAVRAYHSSERGAKKVYQVTSTNVGFEKFRNYYKDSYDGLLIQAITKAGELLNERGVNRLK